MDYHVFKKPQIKNGRKVYKWYYYYMQNGKQIQKACKGCSNRSDAESYIRTLPPLNYCGAVETAVLHAEHPCKQS